MIGTNRGFQGHDPKHVGTNTSRFKRQIPSCVHSIGNSVQQEAMHSLINLTSCSLDDDTSELRNRPTRLRMSTVLLAVVQALGG
jgi:hypothetical protein